ncbi:UDP binding domain-containing protein, partial [Pseudoalteromonas sp. GABNS16H]
DVWVLMRLANHHPRVNILQPGAGVGGHCIAVDPWFIVSQSPNEAHLIRAARNVNDSKPEWVVRRVEELIKDHLLKNPQKSFSDMSVICYGLAFKANIDDLRESPAVKIVNDLADDLPRARIIAVEPYFNEGSAAEINECVEI